MSFVRTYPEHLAAAADNLASIGAAMNAGNATAAGPTTGVVPAAIDEVSILTAMQFASHGARFQELHARACLLYTSPSPRDGLLSRMPSSA